MRLALDITSHRHGPQGCTVESSEQVFGREKKKKKEIISALPKCLQDKRQQMAVDRWEYKEMDDIS